MARLSRQLVCYGACVGILCGAALGIFETDIICLFTSDEATRSVLYGVWPLLCAFQVCLSASTLVHSALMFSQCAV